MTTTSSMRPPSRVLRDLEPVRAVAELGALVAARPLLPLGPRGAGHGVLVMPGFMTTDAATWPLRDVLRRLGHRVRPWGLGRNVGPTTRILRGAARRIDDLYADTCQPVSIVGISLGGVLARDLARDRPDRVRQVITLGSPFALPPDTGHRDLTHAAPLFRALRPWHAPQATTASRVSATAALPVPSTAIYTRTDGIVPWASCIQPDSPCSESVEVWGSHCGLGHSPLALAVVADRLAQPAGTWEPFGWERLAAHARTRAGHARRRVASPTRTRPPGQPADHRKPA